jgi:hypothetical protein
MMARVAGAASEPGPTSEVRVARRFQTVTE